MQHSSKPIDRFRDKSSAWVQVSSEPGFREMLLRLQIDDDSEQMAAFLDAAAAQRLRRAIDVWLVKYRRGEKGTADGGQVEANES